MTSSESADLPEPATLAETRDHVRRILDVSDSVAHRLRELANTLSSPLSHEIHSLASALELSDGIANARANGRSRRHIETLRSRYATPPPALSLRLDNEDEVAAQAAARPPLRSSRPRSTSKRPARPE